MTEREEIVAWLTAEMAQYPGTEYRRHIEIVKNAIERGEHKQVGKE